MYAIRSYYGKKINFEDKTTKKIVDFILSIGIPVSIEKIEEDTFLPGILIKNGAIYIDKEKLKYPGDLLHEAGHLATLTPKKRACVYNDVSKNSRITSYNVCYTKLLRKFLLKSLYRKF